MTCTGREVSSSGGSFWGNSASRKPLKIVRYQGSADCSIAPIDVVAASSSAVSEREVSCSGGSLVGLIRSPRFSRSDRKNDLSSLKTANCRSAGSSLSRSSSSVMGRKETCSGGCRFMAASSLRFSIIERNHGFAFPW